MTMFTAPASLSHLLFIDGDTVYTDSARIAAAFNIPHADVVKAVDALEIPTGRKGRRYTESYLIVDPTGDTSKLEKAYRIAQSGFTMVLTPLFANEDGAYPPKAAILIIEDFLTALSGVQSAIWEHRIREYAEQAQGGVGEQQ